MYALGPDLQQPGAEGKAACSGCFSALRWDPEQTPEQPPFGFHIDLNMSLHVARGGYQSSVRFHSKTDECDCAKHLLSTRPLVKAHLEQSRRSDSSGFLLPFFRFLRSQENPSSAAASCASMVEGSFHCFHFGSPSHRGARGRQSETVMGHESRASFPCQAPLSRFPTGTGQCWLNASLAGEPWGVVINTNKMHCLVPQAGG